MKRDSGIFNIIFKIIGYYLLSIIVISFIISISILLYMYVCETFLNYDVRKEAQFFLNLITLPSSLFSFFTSAQNVILMMTKPLVIRVVSTHSVLTSITYISVCCIIYCLLFLLLWRSLQSNRRQTLILFLSILSGFILLGLPILYIVLIISLFIDIKRNKRSFVLPIVYMLLLLIAIIFAYSLAKFSVIHTVEYVSTSKINQAKLFNEFYVYFMPITGSFIPISVYLSSLKSDLPLSRKVSSVIMIIFLFLLMSCTELGRMFLSFPVAAGAALAFLALLFGSPGIAVWATTNGYFENRTFWKAIYSVIAVFFIIHAPYPISWFFNIAIPEWIKIATYLFSIIAVIIISSPQR